MDNKRRVRMPKNLRRLSLSVERVSDMEILQSTEDVWAMLNLKLTLTRAKELRAMLDRKIGAHDGTNIVTLSLLGPLK